MRIKGNQIHGSVVGLLPLFNFDTPYGVFMSRSIPPNIGFVFDLPLLFLDGHGYGEFGSGFPCFLPDLAVSAETKMESQETRTEKKPKRRK